MQWDDLKTNPNVDGKTRTTILSGSNPKIYIYIFVELSFFISFGTHPSKTGEELLYYHLYHE